MVLESPIIINTERVDKTGVLVDDGIETDKLVSVNLLSICVSVSDPLSSNPLHDSEQYVSIQAPEFCLQGRLVLTGRHFEGTDQEFGKTSIWPWNSISLFHPYREGFKTPKLVWWWWHGCICIFFQGILGKIMNFCGKIPVFVWYLPIVRGFWAKRGCPFECQVGPRQYKDFLVEYTRCKTLTLFGLYQNIRTTFRDLPWESLRSNIFLTLSLSRIENIGSLYKVYSLLLTRLFQAVYEHLVFYGSGFYERTEIKKI